MNQMEQDVFFSILRISLWNREKEKQDLYSLLGKNEIALSSVFKSFEDHALLGVVADTILALSDQLHLNDIQKNYILQYVANSQQIHFKTQQVLLEVFEKFEALGCNPILLKGEGLAQLYPSRCIRACGDVDVYVGPRDFDKAVACLNSMCEERDLNHAVLSRHDYSIKYKGILFEIHFKPGYATVEKAEQRFQELASYWLVPEKCQSISILGKQILIPAAQYNILYVFEHLTRHFRNSELGIRQFLDWALLLEKTDFQESNLKKNLEELFVLDAWKKLGGVLQEGLGMGKIPFIEGNDCDLSKELIRVVMSRGNFGKRKSYLEIKGKFFYLLSLFKKSREVALVFPEYSKKWLAKHLKESLCGFFHKVIKRTLY